MSYSKVHRYFLRTIASSGVMSVDEAHRVLTKFTGEPILLKNCIQEINDVIRPYQQSIKVTYNESTNEEVVIFLTHAWDSISESQKIFTAKELDYFRLLIEEIMSIDVREITGINAINLVNKMGQKISMLQAENLLAKWCKMYYLEKIQNKYRLGVRTINEFEDYFEKYMPDVMKDCYICKKNVFWGANCIACEKAIHTRCLNQYLEKIKKWPCCKIDFSPDQLKQLNESQRMTQITQTFEDTQSIEERSENSTTSNVENDNTEEMERSQNTDNIRRLSRKRKRE